MEGCRHCPHRGVSCEQIHAASQLSDVEWYHLGNRMCGHLKPGVWNIYSLIESRFGKSHDFAKRFARVDHHLRTVACDLDGMICRVHPRDVHSLNLPESIVPPGTRLPSLTSVFYHAAGCDFVNQAAIRPYPKTLYPEHVHQLEQIIITLRQFMDDVKALLSPAVATKMELALTKVENYKLH